MEGLLTSICRASLDCKVYFMRQNDMYVTFLEASVPTFAIDPFGQVDKSTEAISNSEGQY